MSEISDSDLVAISEEEQDEAIIALAELAAFSLGVALGALLRAGDDSHQVEAFLAPIWRELRKHMDVLGCVPGDSMNLGCEHEGREAVAAFPTPPGCSKCGAITPECDCEGT